MSGHEWDKSVDVLVIGSGAGGFVAALAAAPGAGRRHYRFR